MYLEFFPFREPQEVPLGNGMRVLTDMLVSVLYHASSNVTLSDLVYMSVTCSTWSGTGEFTTQDKKRIRRHAILGFCTLVSLRLCFSPVPWCSHL